MERARALYEAGADVLVVDSSQGDSIYQIDLIKRLKAAHPAIQVSFRGTQNGRAECSCDIDPVAKRLRSVH